MTQETYTEIENYMLACMKDSAHDKEHIYRVLYTAMDIARTEETVDYDVLITACLLHDIGRQEQFENPKLCHAQVGSEKAYQFLIENGYAEEFAEHVKACIETHRYRRSNSPQSIEAKILFDADKVDVVGTIGIARTLVYKGQVGEPLYSMQADGQVSDGTGDTKASFFQEYKYKLEGLYDLFFTERGMELAQQRKAAAVHFYESMLEEVRDSYGRGKSILQQEIEAN